jgi:hypothetical protein
MRRLNKRYSKKKKEKKGGEGKEKPGRYCEKAIQETRDYGRHSI